MKQNNLLNVLAIAMVALLSLNACSKDDSPVLEPFVPGINSLPADMQEWVRKYPGEVNAAVPRLESVQVPVSADYSLPEEGAMNVTPLCWQGSGLYVPPAEDITIVVPAGVANLKYRIGVADVELKTAEQKERYHQVSVKGSLNEGSNTLKATFGGPLYFYFDGKPSGDVTVTVSGAVKSNDFVSGETIVGEWKKDIDTSPWGELIGKHVIFTLPASTLKKISNPQDFLNFYDDLFEKDLEWLLAVSSKQRTAPWRIYADAQLPADAEGKAPSLTSSYPMPYVTGKLEEAILGLPQFTGNGRNELLKGILELYSWKHYGKEMKPLVQDMYILRLMQRKGHWADAGIEMTQPKSESTRFWMAREKDKKSMFIQLLQQYGWGMLQYRNLRAAEELPKKTTLPEQYCNDLIAIYAAEYANADLTTFFKDWNFPLSMYAQEYQRHYPAPNRFWDAVDATKVPTETSETPAGISYEKQLPVEDTVYVRSTWSASAGSVSVNGTGNGSVSCLIDGKLDTYYQSASTASYPHWVGMEYKDKNGQAEEIEFNYINLAQRNQSTPGPKVFTIEVRPLSDNPDVWVEIEDGAQFYLTRDYDPAVGNVCQKIYTSKSYKGYGVRLNFSSSLPATEGQNDVATEMSLAELGLGLLK